MIDLIIGSSLFWYISIFLNTCFLGAGITNPIWNLLIQFMWVFLFSGLLIWLLKVTRLYQSKWLIYPMAFLISLVFYILKWLGSDFFNYYSLFFTVCKRFYENSKKFFHKNACFFCLTCVE